MSRNKKDLLIVAVTAAYLFFVTGFWGNGFLLVMNNPDNINFKLIVSFTKGFAVKIMF